MDVKGEHQFEVSAQELWNYLMDVEVLAKITPGISKLELIEADKYKTISDIKIGPVKGSFKGDLEVIEKAEPDSFAIKMVQLSKIGNAHVKVDMKISQNGDSGSVLNFDGAAKLSGVIARTGQRVLSGVANAIIKEVFASLEEHIKEDQTANGKEKVIAAEVEKDTPVVPVKPKEVLEETASSSENKTALVEEVAQQSDNKIEIAEAVKEKNETAKVDVKAEAEKSGFIASIINFFKNLFG